MNADLRQKLKELRLQLNPVDASERSLAAAHLLCQQDFFKNSQHLACYMAHQQEISCQAIMEMAWAQGKEIYLPVINEAQQKLHFKLYQAGDQLEKNQFGILEPLNTAKEINIQDLDLVVVPLVAFDAKLNRLGSGCGYYDKTFSAKPKQLILCGFGYDFQQVDEFQVESWDVPMQYIVTDCQII